MNDTIESLLTGYEHGALSRRDLVLTLAALAAPLPTFAQPSALRVRTLNHASLIVSDLDRSVAFYQRVFGLPVKSTQTGGVNLAVGDDAFVGIYQGGANAAPEINHFCFGLADFDPARVTAALGEHGVQAESRVRDGVTQVYCNDPDGLRVQLQDVSFCGGLGALGNECRA
jgi:catechol 2,3-dioxygenase-like lactoylglutathione lyase family enzyme